MLFHLALGLLLATPQEKPHRIPPTQLNDIATILAHDEGWPLNDPEYTLDPMTPDTDDGFDSIDRTTGQIVDFMRGCQVFRFKDLQNFEQRIRTQNHTTPLTDAQLAKKSGCPSLNVINTKWVGASPAN